MQVKQSERMSGNMQQELEDLHSLQDSVRQNYTHMALNEMISMKQVLVKYIPIYVIDFNRFAKSNNQLFLQVVDLWDCLVPLTKQAAGKVSQQLPSMLETLDSNVSSLVNKLDNLVSRATSGPYLDPDQNAMEMLAQLNTLCSQLYVIAEQLNDQSRASEILRGKKIYPKT